MTLEEINKEVEWNERGRNENSQEIQPWEGERWVTDAKRGGAWWGGWMDRVTVINEKRRRRLKPKDESVVKK